MQISDEIFMQRALQLAKMGQKDVAPNPIVGAVIVYNNNIIGEGYHEKYGMAHAEVNAIKSVKDQSLLKKATIYVTLEPCSHFGKTPPCADLIIKHQFKRIVICNQDPFEQVDGSGIKRLQEANMDVVTGVLAKQGLMLNRRFFTFHEKKRPYIILKWAETKDGYIYSDQQQNNWISNSAAKQLVHQWRAEESAILVGKNTVMTDDPELTTREVKGNNPVRIIVDRNLEIPTNKKVFNTKATSIIVNEKQEKDLETIIYKKASLGEKLATSICELCYHENIQSVIIEGGAQILAHFIQQGIWDEARIIKGNQYFKTGIKSPQIKGETVSVTSLLNNQLTILSNN